MRCDWGRKASEGEIMASNPLYSFSPSDSGILDALGGLAPGSNGVDHLGLNHRLDRAGGDGAAEADESVFSEAGPCDRDPRDRPSASEPHLFGEGPASDSALSGPAPGDRPGPTDAELDEQLRDVAPPAGMLDRLRRALGA